MFVALKEGKENIFINDVSHVCVGGQFVTVIEEDGTVHTYDKNKASLNFIGKESF